MEKKFTLLIVIVLILVGSFIFYEVNYNINHAKLGVAYFEIPEGFHEVNTPNIINLTNGTNSIFILKHTNNDIGSAIKEYKNMIGNNYSVNITKFRINNIEVSKSTINGSNTIHYWFIKNDNLYEIYTWSGNSQTDSIVNGLISSLKFFIF